MSKEITNTSVPPVDFTPELGAYKTLQPFRYWCQKVLPLVYDDSLSYYELLCKVIDYLNKAMEDVEILSKDITGLHDAFEKLQSYVNDYFSSLDIQEEINNKLDALVEDGTLDGIIKETIVKFFNGITNVLEFKGTDDEIIDKAIEKAGEGGVIFMPKKTYNVSKTHTFKDQSLLCLGDVICSGNVKHFVFDKLYGKTVSLFKITNVTENLAYWETGNIGVEFKDCFNSELTVKEVSGFNTGILITATEYGSSNNIFNLFHIVNCKIGIDIELGANGWFNLNTFNQVHYELFSGTGVVNETKLNALIINGESKEANSNYVKMNISIDNAHPEYLFVYGITANVMRYWDIKFRCELQKGFPITLTDLYQRIQGNVFDSNIYYSDKPFVELIDQKRPTEDCYTLKVDGFEKGYSIVSSKTLNMLEQDFHNHSGDYMISNFYATNIKETMSGDDENSLVFKKQLPDGYEYCQYLTNITKDTNLVITGMNNKKLVVIGLDENNAIVKEGIIITYGYYPTGVGSITISPAPEVLNFTITNEKIKKLCLITTANCLTIKADTDVSWKKSLSEKKERMQYFTADLKPIKNDYNNVGELIYNNEGCYECTKEGFVLKE